MDHFNSRFFFYFHFTSRGSKKERESGCTGWRVLVGGGGVELPEPSPLSTSYPHGRQRGTRYDYTKVIVDSEVRGTTLQKLIVDSEVRGTTQQKLIVDSEVRGMTLLKLLRGKKK